MKKNSLLIYSLLILIFAGCNSSKYIPQGKYLLDKVNIKCKNKKIAKSDFNIYLKQHPNKKIFGSRFHLWLYNQSGKNDSVWINRFLKNQGEAPVILDEYYVGLTSRKFKKFLQLKGYNDAVIKDTIIYKKHKAKVKYNIDTGVRFKILQVHYSIINQDVSELVYRSMDKSYIQPGEYLNFENYDLERTRIEKLLKDRGYYDFNEQMISINSTYVTDTKDAIVVIEIKIPPHIKKLHKYNVKNIYVHTSYDSKKYWKSKSDYNSSLDTVFYNGLYYLYKDKLMFKPKILDKKIEIEKKELYNADKVKNTYKSLMSLSAFKLVNIKFKRLKNRELDCNIYLSPTNRYSYEIIAEGTNTSGVKGGEVNLKFNHNNLFNSATNFSVQGRYGLESENSSTQELVRSRKYGISTNITTPNFYIPFISALNKRRYSPRTAIAFSHSFNSRPYYDRKITDISYGYIWKTSSRSRHYLNLLKLNSVEVENMDPVFRKNYLEGRLIENSYKNHILTISNYTYSRNTQKMGEIRDYSFLRFTVESSGSLLTLFNKALDAKVFKDTISEDQIVDYYKFWDNRYAQYFKADVDFRYTFVPNKHTSFATRLYFGIGIPFGNMDVMPFEKKFFSGGTNGVRAWHLRKLGPGGSKSDDPYKMGDIKIEANAEYRFDLFWKLEGAVFADAGNIWELKKNDDNEDAVFDFNKFPKQIAIGAGLGIRLDLTMIIIRLDWARKIYDPAENKPWVYNKRPYEVGIWNFAINYPF